MKSNMVGLRSRGGLQAPLYTPLDFSRGREVLQAQLSCSRGAHKEVRFGPLDPNFRRKNVGVPVGPRCIHVYPGFLVTGTQGVITERTEVERRVGVYKGHGVEGHDTSVGPTG